MRFIFLIITVCTLLFNNNLKSQNTNGFVTLRCGQFYDGNGQPFYPMLCNYQMGYVFAPFSNNTNNLNYILAPGVQYGSTDDYECGYSVPACTTQIQIDLAKIKNMGFNMIRPVLTPKWDGNANAFKISGFSPGNGTPVDVYLQPPYATDYHTQKYFAALDLVIAEAANLGLYSMINGALGDLSDPATNTQYLDFLTALGTHFKNKNHLAFYDILSEPSFNFEYANGHFSKQDACNLVANWYDALKTADPNHLITGGNNSIDEIKLFDPGLTKLDFTQPHIYTYTFPYENNDYSSLLNRIKGHYYWMNKNCPIPWMVGETGYSSSDIYPPSKDIYGSNANQQNFADEVLAATRDFGGLGFTWWDYQDVSFPSPSDGFGLLLRGDISSPTMTTYDKPAVQSFQTYFSPINHQPPLPDPSNIAKPTDYYDPFRNAFYNSTQDNKVSGRIVDVNGNGIADAYIQVKNWLFMNDNGTTGNTTDDFPVNSFIYTFSDASGNFTVIPYNYKTSSDHRITHLHGSAVGAEIFKLGDDQTALAATIADITLHKVPAIGTNNTVSNQTVTIGQTENFKSRNSLSVNNTTIAGNGTTGGTSELKAVCDVVILTEFVAEQGSAVVIENGEVTNDCSDYSGFAFRQHAILSNNNPGSTKNETKNIELSFSKSSEPDVSVFPNPNKGIFTVKVKSMERGNSVRVKLRNMVGESLREFTIFNETSLMDISEFNNGVYLLEIIQDQKRIVKKIIINK